MPSALPATSRAPAPRLGLHLPSSGVSWWLVVLVAALITARLTLVSVQLGCTAALVALVVGLYSANRTAGLGAVWAVWLLTPFVRRVFFLSDPIEDADPLALAPFLVTATVVGLELTRMQLSSRSRRLLALVAAGYAIGVPFGALTSPTSAAFAAFAYLTAAGVFLIGYRDGEGEGGRGLALPLVLVALVPFLALYGIYQYFLDLPEWDFVWFNTADINSAGSPDGDRVRIWSTLNSPGTFGLVLGAAALSVVAFGRLTPVRLAGLLAILAALALTYVRGAWVGVAVGIIAMAVVTRGGIVKQVGPVALIALVLAPVAFGGAVGGALGDRVSTFGELDTDTSSQERIALPVRLVPDAVQLPLGRGIGQAGEATRLGDTGGLRYSDNGYLSLLFQVGPLGFLLVLAALVSVMRCAWRNAWRRDSGAVDVLVFGTLVFMAVMMLGGDQFYGIAGMILWYMAGLAVRRSEIAERLPA